MSCGEFMSANMLKKPVDVADCIDRMPIEGCVSSEQLPRLSEVLSEPVQKIDFKLNFHRDSHKRSVINVDISTCLKIDCQRCGQIMEQSVVLNSILCVIMSDRQASGLPSEYEPLVSADGLVSILDIIEEEILLAIPMVPRHKKGSCSADLSKYLEN